MASEVWRKEAFRHLGGTGTPEAVRAVRDTRPGRGPRKPWFDRIDLAAYARRTNPETKTDATGRTWLLFQSAVLGNRSDLFIVQKLGANWGRPLFTGAWTERTFRRQAPTEFRGIPIAELQATEWLRIFPDDPAIRADTDNDDLTDVVEARLGTDPHKADTDGDGLADAVDPCPNAAPRALGDTEKIIAACVEARFFLEDWGVPAILEVEGVQPFELYGYAPPVLWHVGPGTSPMGELYGGGVNMIGFHLPEGVAPKGSDLIAYGPGRKTARTTLRRYSGGLNGDGCEFTLKKIGDDWFVAEMELRYQS
jgi:hypothetical protein